jgi:hypothetical protein
MTTLRRRVIVLAATIAAALVAVAAASADPTHAKNSFTGMANCTNGVSGPFVVNSANGQGSGSQNNNTAEWTPAHITINNLVFHPSAFINLTFTFTSASGGSQSFTNNDSRPHPTPVTCTISGQQTDPAGDTFSISGQVAGWFS